MQTLYHRIRHAFEQHANDAAIEASKRYHKYEYRTFGIAAPKFYEIIDGFKQEIKELSLSEAKKVSLELALTDIEELCQAAIQILQLKRKELSQKDLSFIDTLSDHFVSWSTVDAFAGHVLQPLIMKYPDEVLRHLRKWNRSKSLWKRRLSVVVFTRKVGKSGTFTKEALELCEAIITDQEDLVRKGIGWALKDMMRGDKERVLNYVIGLRERGISSTITLYALRDIKGEEREKIFAKK